MSICPYCNRTAKIDEDLAECKYCGGPRNIDGQHLKDIIKEKIVKPIKKIPQYEPETKTIDYTDFHRRAEEKAVEKIEAKPKTTSTRGTTYGGGRRTYRKKRPTPMNPMILGVIGILVMGIIIMPGFGDKIFGPMIATVPEGGAWITFHGSDGITLAGLDNLVSIDIFVWDGQFMEFYEAGVFSNGIFHSASRYMQGDMLFVRVGGSNGYCENFISINMALTAEEIEKGEHPEVVQTVKIATDFDLVLGSHDGQPINENTTWKREDMFGCVYSIRNNNKGTGFISSENYLGRYKNSAYAYIRFDGEINLEDLGRFEQCIQTPLHTYVIYRLDDDQITTGFDNVITGATFMNSVYFDRGMQTIVYGVVLNANIEQFVEIFDWGLTAIEFTNSVTFEVI